MKLFKQTSYSRLIASITAVVALEILISAPAFAHHPLDGKIPANFFEGIMSGFAHPMIGFDHLAFIVASGLTALGVTGGIIIPIAFVIATGVGAGIHLAAIDLPLTEIIIAASVLVFGVLLIFRNKRSQNSSYMFKVSLVAAFAGLFHGFAYGEGILGAENTPLVAYLIGFTIIQLAISWGTYLVATSLSRCISVKYLTRFAGGAIAAIGIVFLSSAITG